MKASMCAVVLFLCLLSKQITFNMESNVQTLLFKGIYSFKCKRNFVSPSSTTTQLHLKAEIVPIGFLCLKNVLNFAGFLVGN